MKKTPFLLLTLLFALACTPEMAPPTRDPNYNTASKRIFVRIVTSRASYDTMIDAMARMKDMLLERGHEFSGGIIARERYQLDADAVDDKLAAFKPDVVLEIAPPMREIRWAPIEQVAMSTGSRYYHAVLFNAADKRPVWTMNLFRPVDIGNTASRRITDRTLRQLEADGLIYKLEKKKKR